MTHAGTTGLRKHRRPRETILLDALRAVQDAPEVAELEQKGQSGEALPPKPPPAKPALESYAAAARPLHVEAATLIGMTLVCVAAVCLHAQTWVALALLVRGWLAFGYCALPLASLALLKAYPAAYRRHILQLAWLHHAILAISHHLVDMAGAVQFSPAAGTLAWLGHVCVLAGTNSGATILLCFQLPPVTTAVSACCMAAALASMNGSVCASAFMQLPESAWRIEACYHWLEPLIAPLEPLLLAAGVGRQCAQRHCLCVLAAKQFWLVAVLPTVLVAVQQVRGYRCWRKGQRKLAREWRRKQAESWNFPLMEQSSSSSSGRSSSSGSSEQGVGSDGHATAAVDKASPPPLALLPLSSQLPFVYRKQLAATRHTPACFSGQPHHPDDWQWAAADRALCVLRPTCAMAAVVALAFAAGGSWHQQAFP